MSSPRERMSDEEMADAADKLDHAQGRYDRDGTLDPGWQATVLRAAWDLLRTAHLLDVEVRRRRRLELGGFQAELVPGRRAGDVPAATLEDLAADRAAEAHVARPDLGSGAAAPSGTALSDALILRAFASGCPGCGHRDDHDGSCRGGPDVDAWGAARRHAAAPVAAEDDDVPLTDEERAWADRILDGADDDDDGRRGEDEGRPRRSAAYPERITYADIAAHAADMRAQPWWELHVAERDLPSCPTCGEQMELLLSGSGRCDACGVEFPPRPDRSGTPE